MCVYTYTHTDTHTTHKAMHDDIEPYALVPYH